LTVEIRCVFTVIQIIIQIAFDIPPRSLIANRVWRCNMAFTVIIAKMHKRGGEASWSSGAGLHRGRAFTQAGSSTVSARYRYAVYTFSKRSSRRSFPSPRLPRFAAGAYFLQLAAGTHRVAYFRAHRAHRACIAR